MTEPCMFPNLHEPFYCRIHADVRLRLTDERCRAGVTLTQPQPDAAHEWVTDEKRGYDYCRRCLHVRQANGSSDAKPCKGPAHVALRSTPAAPKDDDRER